ncbi:LSU ribosomal protein L44E8 [Enterospora canceri]|uniref:LSU ribosomal protein L44E8 n=1 Tax=Enterospora canceri TaxID=1081671 RepID=A0A1Y1S9L0_9MICR|nr:LSU ribosomal protein L44E8 [Enterospora canceri]
MDNLNPTVRDGRSRRVEMRMKDGKMVEVTEESIFELIRDIKDPEHPYTLEQLNVVDLEKVRIVDLNEEREVLINDIGITRCIEVEFTPTVPHCSLVGIIGLTLAYKLYKHVDGFMIRLKITENSHSQEEIYNKQLNDEERVHAAFENTNLHEIIENCL